MWEWSFFADFDDETLVPVNLTYQEMAFLSSALTTMENFEDWSDGDEFYQNVEPILALLAIILRQDTE